MVGDDGNIAVVLGTYRPKVRCHGTIAEWKLCPATVYSMDAGMEMKTFGPESDPRSQVILPAIISAGQGVPIPDMKRY